MRIHRCALRTPSWAFATLLGVIISDLARHNSTSTSVAATFQRRSTGTGARGGLFPELLKQNNAGAGFGESANNYDDDSHRSPTTGAAGIHSEYHHSRPTPQRTYHHLNRSCSPPCRLPVAFPSLNLQSPCRLSIISTSCVKLRNISHTTHSLFPSAPCAVPRHGMLVRLQSNPTHTTFYEEAAGFACTGRPVGASADAS